ncbi:MAG TPA: RlmE family RNA methyltransferase [bacterium]|nr:RlmE family RNA methyltransferase [bacterium]
MAYERKDHFYKRAKREGKVSRAVYKLAELQKRFHLVKRGDVVLDLGCAPGGWMREVSPLVGDSGRVIGIDLLPLKTSVPKNSLFIRGDLTDEKSRKALRDASGGEASCVLSDMAPNLSGVAFADAYRSFELATLALDVCDEMLKEGGSFVVKIFPGDELENYLASLRERFAKVAMLTPEATRKTSSERYIVCQGFKNKKPAPLSGHGLLSGKGDGGLG